MTMSDESLAAIIQDYPVVMTTGVLTKYREILGRKIGLLEGIGSLPTELSGAIFDAIEDLEELSDDIGRVSMGQSSKFEREHMNAEASA